MEADNNPSFFNIQTGAAWGKTLTNFAEWIFAAGVERPARTLDVGCGPGLLPALLAKRGCRAVGADMEYFPPDTRLHPRLAQADALRLPFKPAVFDLVTASNVLFLLPDPEAALVEMARLLRPAGLLALLNPSERMSVEAATTLADARGLTGLDRQSLLNWAVRAEAHFRWNEAETRRMLSAAGLEMTESTLKIGPGLSRWVKAVRLR